MSNPRPELIKVYLKNLLAALDEKQKQDRLDAASKAFKELSRGKGEAIMRCRRASGTLRAFWFSRKEAEEFVADPRNADYHGDVVAGPCPDCGAFHADRPHAPVTSVRFPEDPLICAICTEEATGDLLIMPDGLVVHEACCGRVN